VVLRGHDRAVTAVGISPDNHWLVTGSGDSTARLWDLTAKDPAASPVVLRGHESEIRAVGISLDNHWLVTGSDDETACLWDLTTIDPAVRPVVLRGHKGPVNRRRPLPPVLSAVLAKLAQDNRARVRVRADSSKTES
jgi:WD40 repeat protein